MIKRNAPGLCSQHWMQNDESSLTLDFFVILSDWLSMFRRLRWFETCHFHSFYSRRRDEETSRQRSRESSKTIFITLLWLRIEWKFWDDTEHCCKALQKGTIRTDCSRLCDRLLPSSITLYTLLISSWRHFIFHCIVDIPTPITSYFSFCFYKLTIKIEGISFIMVQPRWFDSFSTPIALDHLSYNEIAFVFHRTNPFFLHLHEYQRCTQGFFRSNYDIFPFHLDRFLPATLAH